MEKRKMAKALVMTAALAGGITVVNSFFNEVQASSNSFYCCLGWGKACGTICTNVPGQTQKWGW